MTVCALVIITVLIHFGLLRVQVLKGRFHEIFYLWLFPVPLKPLIGTFFRWFSIVLCKSMETLIREFEKRIIRCGIQRGKSSVFFVASYFFSRLWRVRLPAKMMRLKC